MLPLIVGLGLQTPLGGSLDSTWRGLIQGRFITDHARVPVDPAPGTNRIAALACAAALESLADAGINIDTLAYSDTALVVGTSKGPIEQWLTPEVTTCTGDSVGSALRTITPDLGKSVRGEPGNFSSAAGALTGGTLLGAAKPPVGAPAALKIPRLGADPTRIPRGHLEPTGLADLADQISRKLRLSGPRLTLSAACASGLHALIRGALLLRSGETKRVIVVAAESSLHAIFVGNFQRLGVLAPPGFGCRPFDCHRRGFVMSEAAAAVVLESPDLNRRMPGTRRPIALEQFAFAGDATHLTGNDPQSRALQHILARVIDGRSIDLAHAHGTGTEANDAAELSALQATLPPGRPLAALYSHKGALGHSLGASGLVSVVLNCMSHHTGIIPGNVQTTQPMESSRVEIRQQPTDRKVERSLAIAAGFGGAMAAVTLRSSVDPES